MSDPTEPMRRAMLEEERGIGPRTRDEIAAAFGRTWDTAELQRDFEVKGFMAPFCIAEHKATKKLGTLQFQHSPRVYHSWVPDESDMDDPDMLSDSQHRRTFNG